MAKRIEVQPASGKNRPPAPKHLLRALSCQLALFCSGQVLHDRSVASAGAEQLMCHIKSPVHQAALKEAVLDYALERGGRDTSALEPRMAVIQEVLLEAAQVSAMHDYPA